MAKADFLTATNRQSGAACHHTVAWSAGWIAVAMAAAISVCAPVNYPVDKMGTSLKGLLTEVGSFLLFGLGTVAALTRSSWNHSASWIDK